MKIESRKRALDEVETLKEKWLTYNPLFRSFIPQFDDAFDRGVPMNLAYYVSHPSIDSGTFEEEMCSYLFSTHSNPTGKVYVLEGSVGSGKTCFVRYLVEEQVPQTLPDTLSILLDAWNIFLEKGNEVAALTEAFLTAVEKTLTTGSSRLFKDQDEYFSAAVEWLGYKPQSNAELQEMGQKLRLIDVVRFLLYLPGIKRILIIIDNIDENSYEAIQKGLKFALNLANYTRESREKMCSILITLRDYNVTRFYDIERFAHRLLPAVNEADVMTSKLEQLSDVITATAKDFTQTVSYTRYMEREGRPVTQAFNITITRNKTCDLLKLMTNDLLSEAEPDFLSLIRRLSAGNLKIVVGNTYNFFHSVKLPLAPLFERAFAPAGSIEATAHSGPLVPLDLAIECLLAIHYPFFDTSASHVINIFNAMSSSEPEDFQNTLVIPRLLFTLVNEGGMRYDALTDRFARLGYGQIYVLRGLEKCFSKGLVHSQHGAEVAHLNQDSLITASAAGKCYIDTLLWEPSYLQYVCEDVPICDEHRVSIAEKYPLKEWYGSKPKRMEGIAKLISFLEQEELKEKEQIVEKTGIDEQTYLLTMSVRKGQEGHWINSLLKERVGPRIRKIARSEPA